MAEAPDDMLVLPTLAAAYHAGVLVYVGRASTPPAEADWAEHLRLIGRNRTPEEMRGLVVDPGPGPNLHQRHLVLSATAGHVVRVAVLTNSAIARGIAAVFAFANPGYKAFPLEKQTEALDFLDIHPSMHAEFTQLVRTLEAKLEQASGREP